MADNQWIEKYLRENWTMPFGSLMNAYGLMHQNKPKPIGEFVSDAVRLYKLAQKLIQQSLEPQEEIESEELDFEIQDDNKPAS